MEMTILLIRANRNESDQQALQARGIQSVIDPYLAIHPVHNPDGVERMRAALCAPGMKWLIATSTNSLPLFESALAPGELEEIIRTQPDLYFAAIGSQTELQLRALGASQVLRDTGADSSSLAQLLGKQAPCPVIIPSSKIAMRNFENILPQHGFSLIEEVVYSTETVNHEPVSVRGVRTGEYSGVLLRSPSAVRAFAAFNRVIDIPIFCAGRTTSAQAEILGMTPAGVSPDPSPDSVAQTISNYLKDHNL